MLKAVGGEAVAVGEEEILNAQRLLSHAEGLYVEPTSALPAAALAQLVARGTICEMSTVAMVLTGTGLKTVPS
jgi:threonine synthase